MKQQVVLEVGLFAEAATTQVTFVRPRATVYIHVTLEVARRRERFGT